MRNRRNKLILGLVRFCNFLCHNIDRIHQLANFIIVILDGSYLIVALCNLLCNTNQFLNGNQNSQRHGSPKNIRHTNYKYAAKSHKQCIINNNFIRRLQTGHISQHANNCIIVINRCRNCNNQFI